MSIGIIERLRFDSARCEATFSKGVASNIDEAITEIERLAEYTVDAELAHLFQHIIPVLMAVRDHYLDGIQAFAVFLTGGQSPSQ